MRGLRALARVCGRRPAAAKLCRAVSSRYANGRCVIVTTAFADHGSRVPTFKNVGVCVVCCAEMRCAAGNSSAIQFQ